MKLEDDIRFYALTNAIKYKGKARTKAVLGQVIAKHPSYREKRNDQRLTDSVTLATAIGDLIFKIVGEIPPLAVACLLINMGLDDFCERKKD